LIRVRKVNETSPLKRASLRTEDAEEKDRGSLIYLRSTLQTASVFVKSNICMV